MDSSLLRKICSFHVAKLGDDVTEAKFRPYRKVKTFNWQLIPICILRLGCKIFAFKMFLVICIGLVYNKAAGTLFPS